MKLYIACPSHTGALACGFVTSYMASMLALGEDGIEHTIKFHAGDSAIGRARNHLVMDFLASNCDKLLFLDTDLTWGYPDLKRVLSSDKNIVGGTYPLKGFPIKLNFNPLKIQRPELFGTEDFLTNYKKWVAERANAEGEVEVLHVPTGFLLIDRSVFLKLAPTTDWYYSHDSRTGETRKFIDFFQFRTIDHEYLSEDWFFCHMARAAGESIWLQTDAICGHIGTHEYALGQHVILGQRPLIRPPV